MRRMNREDVQTLAKLLRPAGRAEAGQILIPGFKCAQEYLRAGAVPEWVLLEPGSEEESRRVVGEAAWRRAERENRLCQVRPHEMARLADQPNPEGLVLTGPRPAPMPPSDEAPDLVLDGVSDPGNLGAMLRSALWFGLRRVWLLAPCVDPWSPKVIRAAMGATFHLDECRVLEMDAFLDAASRSSSRFLGLNAAGGYALSDYSFQAQDVLVLGSESHGLRVPTSLLCDQLRIPGTGGIDSINVGHAMAICSWQRWLSRNGAR